MGSHLGADPVVIARRLREIISAVDQWSALDMSKIIMLQMQETLGNIKDRMDSNKNDVKWAEASTQMLKTVSEHYMKMRDLALKETELISDAQMKGLKVLLESAYQPMRSYIVETYPNVDMSVADDIFISALRNAGD